MDVLPDLRRLIVDVEDLLGVGVLGVTVVEKDQISILITAAGRFGDDPGEPRPLSLLLKTGKWRNSD